MPIYRISYIDCLTNMAKRISKKNNETAPSIISIVKKFSHDIVNLVLKYFFKLFPHLPVLNNIKSFY